MLWGDECNDCGKCGECDECDNFKNLIKNFPDLEKLGNDYISLFLGSTIQTLVENDTLWLTCENSKKSKM